MKNPNFHKCRRRRQHNSNSSSSSNNSSNTFSIATTRGGAAGAGAIIRRKYSASCSSISMYLILLLLTTTSSFCAAAAVAASAVTAAPASTSGSPCAPQHWWDQQQNKCMPCTSCQGNMLALRPCQLHIDTVCGSIYDLKIDYVLLAKTEPNWKERRKSSEYEHFEQPTPLPHLTHEPWDWQTGALLVAVLACLLFFSVAACILIHHMRQWRRMERRLDQDVEELSTKLMAKLAEVQSLDGGTFFIGNADVLRGLPASAASMAVTQSGIFQPQHVLLPVEKHAKHQERRILKTLQPGNVYIEENNTNLASSKG
ncbi:tumor necrosis factor receptor superfamily member wengen [Drosophila busckii]|nr:tumor necrosis factor receptor superfamily member wengen [Drosophila busckii]